MKGSVREQVKGKKKEKESENEEPLREHSWCQRDTHFRAPSVKSYLELFLSFSILIPSPRFYHLTCYTKWQKPLELTEKPLGLPLLEWQENVTLGQIETMVKVNIRLQLGVAWMQEALRLQRTCSFF